MIITLARLTVSVAYPVIMICMLLTIIKLIQLLDVAIDIINKSSPRRVTAKRAKKIFCHLKNILIVMLFTACLTLAAAIDLRAAGEEIDLMNKTYIIQTVGGGLRHDCI